MIKLGTVERVLKAAIKRLLRTFFAPTGPEMSADDAVHGVYSTEAAVEIQKFVTEVLEVVCDETVEAYKGANNQLTPSGSAARRLNANHARKAIRKILENPRDHFGDYFEEE